jgi:hypothetical protein
MVSSKRILCQTYVFFLIFGTLGCSGQSVDNDLTALHLPDQSAAQTVDKHALQLTYDDVTVISGSGMEVKLDVASFKAEWENKLGEVEEVQIDSTVPHYTLVLWDRQNNHPSVVQLCAEGIKVDSRMFTSESYPDFLLWTSNQIGRQYFSAFVMERISLSALDLGIKTQVPEEVAEEIILLIQSSSLLSNDSRVFAPLFPYYQLEIEYSGKEFLRLDVLSPTLIQLQDGKDSWQYQLNHSVFTYLKDIIPLTVFSAGHVKSLFQAENVIFKNPETEINVYEHFDDPLQTQSWIHAVTRVLAEGSSTHLEMESHTEQTPLLLEFELTGNQYTRVLVYDHMFVHNQVYYQRHGIRDEITRLTDNLTN